MRILRPLLVMSVAAALVVGLGPLASAKPGDKKVAKQALLRESDLPSVGGTWSAKPRDPASEGEADRIRKDIFECFGVQRAIDRAKKYRTVGDSFTRDIPAGAQSVSDTVYVFPDVKAARSYMVPFIEDDGVDCFRKYLLQRLQNRLPDADVLVQSFEKAPELGDSSVGYFLTATVTDDQGNERKSYYDAFAIRVGRGVTGLSFSSANRQFPGEDAVTKAATDQLEQAL